MSKRTDQDLTLAEQKLFEARLAEAKKRYSDSFSLTRQVEAIRKEILDNRKDNSFPAQKMSFERTLMLPGIIPVISEPQMSPLSNWIAKSAIFAPRPPGQRRDTGSKWVELASPKGVTISYNGPELDMSDHTLYINLIKLAEGRGPNEIIYINRGQLLKRCGYSKIGKSAYEWLVQAFDRLMQANIKICIDNTVLKQDDMGIFAAEVNAVEEINGRKIKKLNLTLKIMGELAETPETGDYYFTLPPTSLALFSNQLYGYNDLLKRQLIQKGQRADLAAWLQSYICSDHTGEHHPILVETLWRFSGSKSRLNDFTTRLKIALDNLVSAEVILSWKMHVNEKKKNLVTWIR